MKKHSITQYAVTFLIALAGAVIVSDFRGAFDAADTQTMMSAVCDGCFTVGALLVCIGGLTLTASGGAFDMLSYGISLLFGLFSKEKRKDKDFYAYSERKKEARKAKLIPFHVFAVGALYLAAAVIVLVAFRLY